MDPFIVGIGGTTRIGSSSERLTSAVLTATERLGARTIMFGGAKLAELPHYAPESSVRTAAECELVEAVRAADGLVIGTPGYHGGISGLIKNAIDLLEDTRGCPGLFRRHAGRTCGLGGGLAGAGPCVRSWPRCAAGRRRSASQSTLPCKTYSTAMAGSPMRISSGPLMVRPHS